MKDRGGLVVTALALALRLAWVLVVPTHPVGDFAMYWESADHLVEHGALDPEFIYMPGYVFLLAGVRALGGGLLAAKLIGVLAGGLAALAVYGATLHTFDRASAWGAGLLCALWPAGIAVSSVTGTDMPAAALLATAVWLLVRDADTRPLRGAILFGLVLGLAATIRAVALPLTLLAALTFAARAVPWRKVIVYTAASTIVAFLVLLPWGVRNARRYGEFFLTDSHGGHTALVGANPNSEGAYSRSLNQMFTKGTGYSLFAEPHRQADRAAYALARRFVELEPAYALGLLAVKADRLLTLERPLLYWPLYRQGVLAGAAASFFARHRAALERLTDGFWFALVTAVMMGIAISLSRRNGPALALLAIPIALVALYVVFFAEVRYHLAIVVLLFPFAGVALRWIAQGPRDLLAHRLNARGRRRLLREVALGAALIALVFAGWPALVAAGAGLRERHRWGVCLCKIAGAGALCAWKPTAPAPGEARSPVRGVWDGIGITPGRDAAAAAAELVLPPGRYEMSMLAEAMPARDAAQVRVEIRAAGALVASATLPRPAASPPVRLAGTVAHVGGNLLIEVSVHHIGPPPDPAARISAPPTIWLTDITLERELP